jgi:hypothetical protein
MADQNTHTVRPDDAHLFQSSMSDLSDEDYVEQSAASAASGPQTVLQVHGTTRRSRPAVAAAFAAGLLLALLLALTLAFWNPSPHEHLKTDTHRPVGHGASRTVVDHRRRRRYTAPHEHDIVGGGSRRRKPANALVLQHNDTRVCDLACAPGSEPASVQKVPVSPQRSPFTPPVGAAEDGAEREFGFEG